MPLNVLIVEDSEDDALLLKRVLEKAGFSPLVFERVDTREDFLNSLDKHNWDIVIADYSMPNFSGMEALAILKIKKYDLPFILVSGVIGEETAVEAMRAGAHDYILKNKLARLIPAIERELREVQVRRERRVAEDALKEEQKRYRDLFENSPVSLWEEDLSLVKDYFDCLSERGVKDFRQHFKDHPEAIKECSSRVRVLRTNLASLRLFEASNFKSLYDKIDKVFEFTSSNVIREEFVALAEGKVSVEGEKTLVTLEGKRKNVAFQLKLLSGYEKTLGRLLVSFIDLTDRKLMETELLKAKEAAEAANRAKDQFLANMTHELRTPLNPVIGFTELLLEMELPPDQREYLEIIKQRSYDLLAVIDDLLEFSQMESYDTKPKTIEFHLKQLIMDSVQRIGPFASSKGLQINWDIAPEAPTRLIGDPTHVRQILNNLLSNSVKFTETGAITLDISIDTERTPYQSKFVYLHFSLKDTGIGIPPDKIESIFAPFTQVDNTTARKFGGTGLGLAIVRRVVEMLEGKIWVESETGVGSIFHVILGFEKLPEEEPLPKSAKNKAELGRNLRVLVVEDEPSNRHLAVSLLKKMDHDVKYVENGLRALEIIEQETFDILLMDIQMPEMDGIAATARIREMDKIKSKHTPIVALTAYASEIDKERFLNSGMDAFLAKPINRDEFYKVIKEVAAKFYT
ncbi:MAG: response regulator [Candidatus Riflebacteria bacterium]|nr:response regulator [Candidatus Riflebacteria bacterium]